VSILLQKPISIFAAWCYNRPPKDVSLTPQGKTIDQVESPVGGWVPETKAERDAIREQLERILANAQFRHSKRCPALLRYVVEHALSGNTSSLKERTLGMEVFGRDPGYDTNVDPVVRSTAGEIRKRIAQYYYEPGHEREIRIDLPSGSYVPEFHLPLRPRAVARVRATSRWPIAAALAAAFVVAATLGWAALRKPPSALEQFWRPILASSNPVLLCVGQPRILSGTPGAQIGSTRAEKDPELPVTVQDLHQFGNQHVALSDAITFSRLAALLQANGKAYRIRGRSNTTLADLRDGPVILIGAFNNDWTLRLTGAERFSFERDPKTPNISWIRDQQNPSNMDWRVDFSMPYLNLTADYAIISRVLDPTLDRMVVVAAGIAKFGTIAAGEFLTDPEHLQALLQQAPPNWDRKNFEAVIETKVINGNSGPPRLVATHFW
jgi:hypothetical protein